MSLCLSNDDLQKVRGCWNNVQINNKYHKDQFIGRLFSNLLAANADLKSFFKSDLTIREHSLLFNDLLNYVILYLDNVDRLNQFLILFFKENSEVIQKIHYLEPMGTALIQTFRQWLGKGLFNDNMEQLWVQIYIHLANNMLMFADDSDHSDMESEDNASLEEIQGLNINKQPVEPETMPMSPVSPPSLQQVEEEEEEEEEPVDDLEEYKGERPIDLTRKPSIQVNIKSNDKYRGFRRNDSSVVDVEPVLTPRSPRREVKSNPIPRPAELPTASPSLTAKFNNLKPKVVYDSDEEEPSTKFGFDPRKSRRASDMFPPKPIEKDFHYSIKRQPSFEEEEENSSINLDEKPSELDITLNPMAESSDNEEQNDNSSSIYHSEVSEPSSQDQSLSLHSHYSEGTEGTEPMSVSHKNELRSVSSSESSVENARVFSKDFASRQTSISSVEPEFMASVNNGNMGKLSLRYQNNTRHSASPSINTCQSQTDLNMQKSIQLSQRASLGFMRSSFILKKEIDTIGHNLPENVLVRPPTMPAAMRSQANASTPNLRQAASHGSFKPAANNGSTGTLSEEDQSYDLINTFMPITDNSKANYKKFTASCTNLPSSSPSMRSNSMSSTRPQNRKATKSTLNLAKHNNYDPMSCSQATASIRGTNLDTSKVKTKRSFKDKMKSLFGGSSANVNVKPSTQTISSPIETTYSTNSSVPRSSISSKSASTANLASRTSHRLSRMSSNTTVDQTRGEEADKFTQMNKFEKKSKMASMADLRSVNSTMDDNESTSGFSFFSKRNSIDSKSTSRYSSRGDRTKKNKYNVTKTPYDVFAHNKLVF